VNKRVFIGLGKYLLAAGLMAWVVWSNWAPPPRKAIATLAAGTAGLCATPGGAGPLLAAALPADVGPKGIGYIWRRHVMERRRVHAGYLATGFIVYAAAVLLGVFRWHLLVRALGLPLAPRDALRYGLLGVFFNTFLPGSVGGDIVKAGALARAQSRRAAAVATVIMDRAIALWALVWFVAMLGGVFWLAGLLSGPAGAAAASIVWGALAVAFGTGAVWLLVGLLPDRRAGRFAARLRRLPLAGRAAADLWRAAWAYRRRQGSVAAVMLLSGAGHAGFVVAFYCCARALWSPGLGPVPSLTQHFLLVPVGLTMQALVPTPGGAGGGEWGFAALYLLFGGAEVTGVLASLVQRALSWALGLASYVAYLGMRPAPAEPSPRGPALAEATLLPAAP
jgi:uncharacterized membrane protein YbhN (UPF0104 family)